MVDPIEELKTRATLVHRRLAAGDPSALARLAKHNPAFREASGSRERESIPEIRRKHCLDLIAGEFGFSDWRHAKSVLDGTGGEADFGTTLYPRRGSAFLNLWFSNHAQARDGLEQSGGGYLLGYRSQALVTCKDYIRSLELDPDDPDWRAIGHDWMHPAEPEARRRLYGKLFARRPREAA